MKKQKLNVFRLSEAPTIAQGQQRGRPRRNISLSVFLWRQGEEGGTGGGVAMGTDRGAHVCVCMHVNECVCVYVTLLDQGLSRARRLLKLPVLLWSLSFYRLWHKEVKGGGGVESDGAE